MSAVWKLINKSWGVVNIKYFLFGGGVGDEYSSFAEINTVYATDYVEVAPTGNYGGTYPSDGAGKAHAYKAVYCSKVYGSKGTHG